MNSDKHDLRKAAHNRRAEAFRVVDVAPALNNLKKMLAGTRGAISFYWPIRSEIDPRPVMEKFSSTRTVCLPVTHGRDAPLSFRAWKAGSEMDVDGFGVSVPVEEELVTPSVLVVPMLAFDVRCHRLGYGAGHYDRTLFGLRKNGSVQAIGFAFSAQRENQPLPIEATDEPLDAIVTEAGVIYPT